MCVGVCACVCVWVCVRVCGCVCVRTLTPPDAQDVMSTHARKAGANVMSTVRTIHVLVDETKAVVQAKHEMVVRVRACV